MRIHGTRLPICEKNVGQAKFAFNALQVKSMPDMLKLCPVHWQGFSRAAGCLVAAELIARCGFSTSIDISFERVSLVSNLEYWPN